MTKIVKHSEVNLASGGLIYEYKEEMTDTALSSAAIEDKKLQKAKSDARMTLKKANTLAGQILEKASRKARSDREKAEREGYLEGLRQAKAEAEEQYRRILEELTGLLASLEREKAEILRQSEEGIKDLAIDIAQKLVNYQLDIDNDVFISLFKSAVHEIGESQWVRVMVSESQATFATAYADLLLSMVRDAREIKVETLEDAPPGALLIETQQGYVDAGVQTQIARVRSAFHEEDELSGRLAGA